MKKLAILISLISFFSLSQAQTTLYSEDFNGQDSKGAVGGIPVVYDTSGVNWNIMVNEAGLTASSDFFKVDNGVFDAQDIDEVQIWQSNPVSLTGFSNVSLSVDVSEVGTMESADFFDFEYSLDGGNSFTKVTNWNGLGDASHTLIDDFSSATISVTGLSGTSLVLKFSMLNNSGTENIRFDNVLATGTAAGSLFANISNSNDASCNGSADGSITVSTTNGAANYDYAWSNGSTTNGTSATTNSINGLVAGTYTVTVTDANNNTATASTTILEPSAIVPIISVDNNASCNGSADGMLSVNATGGTGSYTYSWSNNTTNQTASSLSAGMYTITVTDANGCTATAGENVSEPNAIAIALSNKIDESCTPGGDGEITVNANGGTGTLTFDWSTGFNEIGATKVVNQSFESNATDTWNYIISPATYNTSGDVWATVSSLGSISGPSDQSNFFGMQDLDNGNGGGSFYHTITFDPVDVSSIGDANLKFDYYTDGFDSADELEYEVVFDNGTIWSTNGIALIKDNQGWETVTVSVPAATNFVRLRIQASQNGGSDYAGIDNVYIEENVSSVSSTISNLAYGSYDVTVTDGNGCTATNGFNVGIDFSNCATPPQNLRSLFMQDTAVTLSWDTVPNASMYKILWRPASASNWTGRFIKNVQVGRLDIDTLQPNTKYFWAVRAKIKGGNWTGFSSLENFHTLANPCVNPTGLSTTGLLNDRAKISWNIEPNSLSYRIRYREVGSNNWSKKLAQGRHNKEFLQNLNAATTYEWQIKSVCEYGPTSGNRWSSSQTFTTSPMPVVSPNNSFRKKEENAISDLNSSLEKTTIFPNPNKGEFTIALPEMESTVSVKVMDISGKVLFEKDVDQKLSFNSSNLNIQESGVYFISLQSKNENIMKRVVVNK